MDTRFINLKFESNRKILEVGNGKPYRLLRIEGIDSGEYELSISDNILTDGSRVNNRRIKSRPIAIEAEYVGRNSKNERDRIIRFFNIHQGGILTIDLNGITRTIPYEIEGFKSKLDNLYMPLRFLVQLYCPNPFLLGEFEEGKEIVTWIGGMSFPLRLPTRFAMAGPKTINIVNDGDVETPAKIVVYGPATNPKIQKRGTGEYLRIKKKLTSDDVVTITTEFGNKRVELNGENAFNILDLPTSKFFSLDVGDNVIELTTEDVNNNANAKISYRNRYIGV